MNPFTISNFGLKEATECSFTIRKIGKSCNSMEEVSKKIVDFFYDTLFDERTAEKDFSLVRIFKTHDYGKLDVKLRKFVTDCFPGHVITTATKCLTLLATTGIDENWKDRKASIGHKTIPLSSEDVVNKLPMIRNLIKQLGLDIRTVINPDPELIHDLAEKTYNVFLVPHALGSAFIPAQEEFVVPFHIQSVLGFGGVFPDGNIFTVIIFSKKIIADEVAELFKTIALSAKVSLLPWTEKIFK
jgi:hypothetical protein